MKPNKEITERLEYLRTELRNECISQGELIELQSLSKYIDKSDVELLEAAGVPEFENLKVPIEAEVSYKTEYINIDYCKIEIPAKLIPKMLRAQEIIKKEGFISSISIMQFLNILQFDDGQEIPQNSDDYFKSDAHVLMVNKDYVCLRCFGKYDNSQYFEVEFDLL